MSFDENAPVRPASLAAAIMVPQACYGIASGSYKEIGTIYAQVNRSMAIALAQPLIGAVPKIVLAHLDTIGDADAMVRSILMVFGAGAKNIEAYVVSSGVDAIFIKQTEQALAASGICHVSENCECNTTFGLHLDDGNLSVV